MRRLRSLGSVLLAVALISGCSDASLSAKVDDDDLPKGPFRIVAQEQQGLNGAENRDRPPIAFFLIGASAGAAPPRDGEALVESYVAALRRDGWAVAAYSTSRDWWTFDGRRGSDSVRIGTVSMFTERATPEVGYARTRFRRLASEMDEPLVVVSIDPQE